MKTLHQTYRIAVILLIVLLAITGCQSKSAEPTVVSEREANCPIVDFTEGPSTKAQDPELGPVDRAFVIEYKFTCPEPYVKGRAVAIQDGWYLEDGNYFWTAMSETITDEGGVWKGTCESSAKTGLSNCKFTGEGKYKGLQASTEYNLNTNNLKIRITKVVEE